MKNILKVRDQELCIEMVGNAIKSTRKKDITRKGVQIIDNNRVYSACMVGDIDDDKLISNALKEKDSYLKINHPLPFPQAVVKKTLAANVDLDAFYSDTEAFIEKLKQNYPQFIFSGQTKWQRKTIELNYLNDTVQENSYDTFELGIMYRHKNSTSIIDGFFGNEELSAERIFDRENSNFFYLEQFEKQATIKEGKIPVVFRDSQILLYKLLESCRIDTYHEGTSLLKDKLNQDVFSDEFSLLDVSYNPKLLAFTLFDGEGFVRSEPSLPLIENGIFKNIIADSRLAHKYNGHTTGNALRTFDSQNRLGFHTPHILPGTQSCKDIINSLPECIFVEVCAGGSFSDNGDFSTPAQGSYLFKNGEIVGRLPQLTLTSTMNDMFGDALVAIASDSFINSDKKPGVFTAMNVYLN